MCDVVQQWLLEDSNPSVRYLALVYLLEQPASDERVRTARLSIPGWGPAKTILEAQWPEGFWMEPGVGYSPKHRATVWQLIFLAAMGSPLTQGLRRACSQVLEHSRLPDGRFSAYKSPRGAIPCLNGNLLRAFLQLGYPDPRVGESIEMLAKAAVQHGFRCRYNAGSPPPLRAIDALPCAWGVVKALGAFAEIPDRERSADVQAAIAKGIDLLWREVVALGAYPTPAVTSPQWLKYGFPLGFTSDALEALEVLSRLGFAPDATMSGAIDLVISKRDERGRWRLEYTPENCWCSFGRLGAPNKWVTLRALRVLKAWDLYAARN